MRLDIAALEKYDIFEGVMGNNLTTLLDCISAKEVSCGAGEVILTGDMPEKKVALVLEGEILAKNAEGKEITIKEGDLFGKDFPTEVKAGTDCRALVFNHREVYTPCWFSCFFHAGFIENVEKAAAK